MAKSRRRMKSRRHTEPHYTEPHYTELRYMCHCCSESDDHKLERCSGCQKVYYCSTACQKYDWVGHIFDCEPHRPITTADYLALAVRENLPPEHPQTCEEYGFNRALTVNEKTMLLDLYIGLIEDVEIPPQTIHNWRVRGELVDEIKNAFCKLPEGSRGGYFRWFLQNERIIAPASGPLSEETSHDHVDAMLVRAWKFTGGSERDSPEEIRAATSRKPKSEQECHWLYVLLLSKRHPSPDLDLWLDFGFAACTSRDEEMALGARYQALITMCTFNDFCGAYRAGCLLDLFDSKGLQMNDDDHLRDLFCAGGKKSVWYLKQSVIQLEENSTNEEPSMHPAVMADYGFINCRDDSERRQLKRVYKAFFDTPDGDPLALHGSRDQRERTRLYFKIRAWSSRSQVPAAHERPVPSSGLVTSHLTTISCPGLLL